MSACAQSRDVAQALLVRENAKDIDGMVALASADSPTLPNPKT